MKRLFRIVCLALLFALGPLLAQADELVTLNFVNSDIESTIKAVGVITGKNFVLDPKVKGTINIVSNQPVARDMVYLILLSALRQQGFTAIDNGSIIKVMPENDAKTQSVQVPKRRGKSRGDQIITQAWPLKHESAAQLANTLRPLVSASNLITAYPGNNTLIITDYADNVERIRQMIDEIDQPGRDDVIPISIKYASALDIAQTIARLMPEVFVQGVAAPPALPEGVRRTVIVPDVRSNQLLVRSVTGEHARQIRSLVRSLDTPSAAEGNINVVYLRNAEAVHLANTLKGILTGQSSGSTSSSSSSSNQSGFGSSPFGTQGSGSTSGQNLQTSSNTTSSTGSNTTLQGASASVQVSGANVLIQADPVTNSLVITAPDHIYKNLRSVIDKLDVRRAQIYIEALIAEVNVSKTSELGVQWMGAGGNDSLSGGIISAIGSGANNLSNIAAGIKSSTPMLPTGFSLGLFNGDPTKGTASLGLLARAIENTGDGNILSTPNLLMLDNEEAKIIVGQNIPLLTGSYTTSASGSSNPFQTVERKDIGIKLKIRPQISDAGAVTLTVAQEVSSIDNSVNTGGAGIATKVRMIETKVLVDDGQIIVLGGLIEEKLGLANNKVPLLGDIPLVGGLFNYEERNQNKVNLMVFLRPVVLRDAQASRSLSTDRYQYLRTEQGKFASPNSLVLDDLPKIQLPPLDPRISDALAAPPSVESVATPAADRP